MAPAISPHDLNTELNQTFGLVGEEHDIVNELPTRLENLNQQQMGEISNNTGILKEVVRNWLIYRFASLPEAVRNRCLTACIQEKEKEKELQVLHSIEAAAKQNIFSGPIVDKLIQLGLSDMTPEGIFARASAGYREHLNSDK